MAVLTARQLVTAGPAALQRELVRQNSSEPSNVKTADFNHSLLLASPTAYSAAEPIGTRPFAIRIEPVGLPIEVPGQEVPVYNPYVAASSSLSPTLSVLRTPAGEVDLTANQIAALSQVDWLALAQYKAAAGKRGVRTPDKGAVLAILAELGYRIPPGKRAARAVDPIGTLLAYKPLWDRYQERLRSQQAQAAVPQLPLLVTAAPAELPEAGPQGWEPAVQGFDPYQENPAAP